MRDFWLLFGSQYNMQATVYFIYALFTVYFLQLQGEEIICILKLLFLKCYTNLCRWKEPIDLMISEAKMDIYIWLYGYLQSL